jgi:hypothetical protein
MVDSEVLSNTARDNAGGLFNSGSASLERARVAGNNARVTGGIRSNDTLRLTEVTIAGNAPTGLSVSGSAWVEASTISSNTTTNDGGGIINSGSITLTNSTISGNVSGDAGSGIYNWADGYLTGYNVTIALNRAGDAGEFTGDEAGITTLTGGLTNLRNSLVAGNFYLFESEPILDDCYGTVNVYGRTHFTPYNGIGQTPPCTFSGTGQGLVSNLADDLGPLAANGGPTFTHALLAGNPAIDGADPTVGCLAPVGLLPVDQRGFPRIFGVRCDAGALEQGSLLALFLPLIER